MTEREIRNEEWKNQVRMSAEMVCKVIDRLEAELKDRERMTAELSREIDRLRKQRDAA